MLETSARLLALLSLLQTRREWSGPELAERLDITTRTVRRDIDKLRELGYPVDANVGSRGGYRLGAGAEMPPLLLDDQEVLAVALGLDAVTTGAVADMAEASAGALASTSRRAATEVSGAALAGRAVSMPSCPPEAAATATPCS